MTIESDEAKQKIKAVSRQSTLPAETRMELFSLLFPECVSEGKLDLKNLETVLGGRLETKRTYGLQWAGKEQALQAIHRPSWGTLKPEPEQSIDFEETRNIFIEGENLEVLRLLYKSYYGRVKMIYLDPPYNIDKGFVYPDNFSEPRRAYLQFTGQMDNDGNILTSNLETSGRHHSSWLSMMYPRIFFARQLLREDGFIFVSIDDQEVHNLRLLMNEVFGEENFVAQITWQRKKESANDNKGIGVQGEYVLCYSRSPESLVNKLPLSDEYLNDSYREPTDEFPEDRWRPVPITRSKGHQSKGYTYSVVTPSGREITREWLCPRRTYEDYRKRGRLYFGKQGDGIPQRVMYAKESPGVPPSNVWSDIAAPDLEEVELWTDVATNKEGKNALVELFDGQTVFETPKPTKLIRRMLEMTVDKDESPIVLDFFAGSGTTGQAVFEFNLEHGAAVEWIQVQLPEPVEADSVAAEEGYANIAQLALERIRRAADHLEQQKTRQGELLSLDANADLGCRVFRLDDSNLRQWQEPAGDDLEALVEQMEVFDEGLKDGVRERDVLFELVLREGFSLNARIDAIQTGENQIYKVTNADDDRGVEEDAAEKGETLPDNKRQLYACLDAEIASEVLDDLDLDDEAVFICRDSALDDALKVNLSLECILKVI